VSRKKLGKYEIIERIGRGGMAEVYRGYHAALDRYVAIKLLHPFLADDPEFKDRFENEARNVAKLRHPNIVQVYDFEYDEEGDSYYMVMEMINGPTLKDRLFDLEVNNDSFSVGEAIRIVKSAAEALAYAHQRSMIHRDVKPANLMLDEDGRVVLTDFGIAKIVTGAQFTASGGMVGTPAYMAPEQGLGEAGDERSDIYSLGVILYQLITGRLPYDADTPLAIILKHVNSELPLPSRFVDIPEDLEKIICRALEKEPEDRYQTAIEFAQDLSLLDETGRRIPMYDPTTGLPVNSIPSPFDTKSVPPTPAQRARLAAAAEAAGLTVTPSRPVITANRHDTPAFPPPPPALPVPGAPGRLRPAGAIGITAALIVIVMVALFGFGSGGTPFAGLLGSDKNTNTPQLTETALALLNLTPNITPTDTPGATITPSPTLTLTPTDTPSPTPTGTPSPTPTDTPTPTLTPTDTPSPTATGTPTPDLTGTAVAHFFETLAAASPTPNMTQTLAACDFEYIVVEPDRYNVPPAFSETSNPRLIRAGGDFTLDIVFQNTGSCNWPEGVRMTYNAELTQNPDETVNLAPLREACTNDLRPGLNFARQEQSNFFMTGSVDITKDSNPITFTGTAPNVFGCYYGVWDLLYPNSSMTIGRPLVLTIRVWGGG
jgi:serine/threonine protein kinase